MRTYTIDEMKRAFECGRNFQLTAENNFKELIEELNQALYQPLVSGSLPCHHNFIQKDTYWKSCTHCGMLAPLGQ